MHVVTKPWHRHPTGISQAYCLGNMLRENKHSLLGPFVSVQITDWFEHLNAERSRFWHVCLVRYLALLGRSLEDGKYYNFHWHNFFFNVITSNPRLIEYKTRWSQGYQAEYFGKMSVRIREGSQKCSRLFSENRKVSLEFSELMCLLLKYAVS